MIPDLPSAVVARLKAGCDVLRDVGGAAGLDSIDEQLATVPAAFAIPLAERPTDPPTAAQFSQLVDVAVERRLYVADLTAGTVVLDELERLQCVGAYLAAPGDGAFFALDVVQLLLPFAACFLK